ncbi:hypothetical protein LUZ60_002922 [Juncus effusus]|nr:hypothetical protein LUZ60_002922 [Juncus effusus]
MVATNLKAETKSLMDQRDGIESEMNALIDTLCRPGGPGISGGLADSEGFPRSDLDIPAVLAQRKRLSELRNDYKDITNKIDKNIQILHSAKLAPPKNLGQSTSSQNSQTTPMLVDQNPIAFATIDEIAEDSPAATDGLQLGDEIVRFGSVQVGDGLQGKLVSEAQSNVGNELSVVVLRNGEVLDLRVTPRNWRGRGLLGCHFRFL